MGFGALVRPAAATPPPEPATVTPAPAEADFIKEALRSILLTGEVATRQERLDQFVDHFDAAALSERSREARVMRRARSHAHRHLHRGPRLGLTGTFEFGPPAAAAGFQFALSTPATAPGVPREGFFLVLAGASGGAYPPTAGYPPFPAVRVSVGIGQLIAKRGDRGRSGLFIGEGIAIDPTYEGRACPALDFLYTAHKEDDTVFQVGVRVSMILDAYETPDGQRISMRSPPMPALLLRIGGAPFHR